MDNDAETVPTTSPRATYLAHPPIKMATITCMNIAGAVKHACSSKCAHRGCVPEKCPEKAPIGSIVSSFFPFRASAENESR